MVDRDAGARGESAVLVRVAVHGVLEQIGSDAAVVQKRVALAGRAVADHALAATAALQQELQHGGAGIAGRGFEAAVSLHRVQAGPPLLRQDLQGALAGRAGVRGRRGPQADRPTVRRQGLDVDHRQITRLQRAHGREHRPVLEVLVVDGVELRLGHQLQRVVHLDGDQAVVRHQRAQARGEAEDVGDVGVDVVRHHQRRGTVVRTDPSGGLRVQERRHGGHPRLPGRGTDVHAGLDSQTTDSALHDVPEQIAVVARHLHHERLVPARRGRPRGRPVDETTGVLDPTRREGREVRVLGEGLVRADEGRDLQQQAVAADPEVEGVRGLGFVETIRGQERFARRGGAQIEDTLEVARPAEATQHFRHSFGTAVGGFSRHVPTRHGGRIRSHPPTP